MLFPVVEGTVTTSAFLFRLRKNQNAPAMAAIIIAATKKNVTPTCVLFCQKPFFFSGTSAAIVVAASGGAVGVTVNVLTSPVTVMTDMNGVGVHVLLDDEVVLDEELVEEDVEVVGMGVDDVEDVVGVFNVIDIGIKVGVGVLLVLVDVVDGV